MKKCVVGVFMLFAAFTVQATPVFYESGYTATAIGTSSAGYGSVAAAESGQIFFTDGNGSEIFVTDLSGNQTTFDSIGGVSMGLGTQGNTLYAGNTAGSLYSYDLSSATPNTASLVAGFSGTINDIAFAAPGTTYAGQLLLATQYGLKAYDTVTGTITTIYGQNVSGVDVRPNGNIVVAQHYSTGQGVVEFDSSGNVLGIASASVFRPDGVAAHAGTGEVFALDPYDGVYRVDTSDYSISLFADNVASNGGWYPSRLDFTADQTNLLIGSRNTLWAVSGFDGISVPGPASIWIFSLALLLLARFKLSSRAV